jgi:hypothetical protein
MDVTKPYKFRWFGDIHGPKRYQFIGSRWAFISQTPVRLCKKTKPAGPNSNSSRKVAGVRPHLLGFGAAWAVCSLNISGFRSNPGARPGPKVFHLLTCLALSRWCHEAVACATRTADAAAEALRRRGAPERATLHAKRGSGPGASGTRAYSGSRHTQTDVVAVST